MAVTAARVSVGTAATKIAENTAGANVPDAKTVSVIVKNTTATAAVALGGDNTVTVAGGFTWAAADGPLAIDLEPGEQLWGIVASGSQALETLKAGR